MLEAKDLKILGIGSSGLNAEQMVYNLLYQDCYTESVTSKTKMYYLSRSLKKKQLYFFTPFQEIQILKLFLKLLKKQAQKLLL